jgi:hypothetical protein
MQQRQKFAVPSDLLEQVKGECEQVTLRLGGEEWAYVKYFKGPFSRIERSVRHHHRFYVPDGAKKKYCVMGMLFKAMGHDAYDERVDSHWDMLHNHPKLRERFDTWNKMYEENMHIKNGTGYVIGSLISMNDSGRSIDEIQNEFRGIGL